MKSFNKIIAEIVENGLAANNDELENQFDFAASEEGYSPEQIADAKEDAWFPWFENPAENGV